MIAMIPVKIPIPDKTYELISNGFAEAWSPLAAEDWPTTSKINKLILK